MIVRISTGPRTSARPGMIVSFNSGIDRPTSHIDDPSITARPIAKPTHSRRPIAATPDAPRLRILESPIPTTTQLPIATNPGTDDHQMRSARPDRPSTQRICALKTPSMATSTRCGIIICPAAKPTPRHAASNTATTADPAHSEHRGEGGLIPASNPITSKSPHRGNTSKPRSPRRVEETLGLTARISAPTTPTSNPTAESLQTTAMPLRPGMGTKVPQSPEPPASSGAGRSQPPARRQPRRSAGHACHVEKTRNSSTRASTPSTTPRTASPRTPATPPPEPTPPDPPAEPAPEKSLVAPPRLRPPPCRCRQPTTNVTRKGAQAKPPVRTEDVLALAVR